MAGASPQALTKPMLMSMPAPTPSVMAALATAIHATTVEQRGGKSRTASAVGTSARAPLERQSRAATTHLLTRRKTKNHEGPRSFFPASTESVARQRSVALRVFSVSSVLKIALHPPRTAVPASHHRPACQVRNQRPSARISGPGLPSNHPTNRCQGRTAR